MNSNDVLDLLNPWFADAPVPSMSCLLGFLAKAAAEDLKDDDLMRDLLHAHNAWVKRRKILEDSMED